MQLLAFPCLRASFPRSLMYCPNGHSLHWESGACLSDSWKKPAGHILHAVDVLTKNMPLEQFPHRSALAWRVRFVALSTRTRPAGQPVQFVTTLALCAWYFPAAHTTQLADAAYVPSGQYSHWLPFVPAAFRKRPNGQSEQIALDTVWFAG